MDNKKVIFAIAAAVIVVAAAVGIGVFAMNKDGGGSGNAKDTIKGNIAVGDYYVMDVNLEYSSGETASSTVTKENFFNGLFAKGTQSEGSETITVSAGTFTCNKTSSTESGNKNIFWNDSTTGWMVKRELRDSDSNLLLSLELKNKFGFDFTKDRANQSLDEEYYIEYDYKLWTGVYGMAVGSMMYYVDSVGSTDLTLTTSVAMKIDKDSHRLEIASIYGDTVTYKDGLGKDTKGGFLSYVSFTEFKKDISGSGTVKTVSKTDKTVDTPFGKRDVTVEKLEVTEAKGVVKYTVVHGGDVIYSVDIDGFSSALNLDVKGSIVLIGTSMFA